LQPNNTALVLGFLGRVFVEFNARFPKSASEYLDDWLSPDPGWLRKFYRAGSDEARFDVVPAVQKGLRWVNELRTREFIGTESSFRRGANFLLFFSVS
jgi:hypothetical protein